MLIAAYTPGTVSVPVGQAAFTAMVIVAFNIIEPTGWSIGVVRIVNVGWGALAALVTGLLFWPRGARSQARILLGEFYVAAADHVGAAFRRVLSPSGAAPPTTSPWPPSAERGRRSTTSSATSARRPPRWRPPPACSGRPPCCARPPSASTRWPTGAAGSTATRTRPPPWKAAGRRWWAGSAASATP